MEEKIDFVIIWVDGNDPEWQKEKEKYKNADKTDNNASGTNRYREWDNLQYWFRGVEKFAPWVNKIHFVTCGHLPKWLNVNHPKLNIVKHSDYIPEEYLPTFSSHVIELNLHRIKELSENFVYFNDDMFLIDSVKEDDFFIKGKPTTCVAENAVIAFEEESIFPHVLLNNVGVINKRFVKRKVQKENFTKWFNIRNGKRLIQTILLLPWKNFTGFFYAHLANAYKKTTFEELWNEEFKILDATSKNKFRTRADVNQFIFADWQIAKGNVEVQRRKLGKRIELRNDTVDVACEKIINQKYKMICLNDSDENIDFESAQKKIKDAFEKILPEKSEFEI